MVGRESTFIAQRHSWLALCIAFVCVSVCVCVCVCDPIQSSHSKSHSKFVAPVPPSFWHTLFMRVDIIMNHNRSFSASGNPTTKKTRTEMLVRFHFDVVSP